MPDLLGLDLRVVDGDVCAFREEVADDGDGRRLASVTGVGLERKAKDGDVLRYQQSRVRGPLTQSEKKRRTLPVMVLKSVSTTVLEKRRFWYSFISTT